MRGQVVVYMYVIGHHLKRIVWEDSEALILVHTEDQFIAHEKGILFLEPVGFTIKDVFNYVQQALESDDPWGKLEQCCPVTG